jgi:adenine C2-methylase RlmN of 23S rRNA A2503 and tRNA A37
MLIEVSVGEFIDKITILDIKMERISDPNKFKNIKSEYDKLCSIAGNQHINLDSTEYYLLKKINEDIWEAEEIIRRVDDALEIKRLSKIIYNRNDERAMIKKKINTNTNSTIVEEKSWET